MTKPTFAGQGGLPRSRISGQVELESSPGGEAPSAIHSIRISGGVTWNQVRAVLSADTVIGGRGTGKSTLIECLRFALDVMPKGVQAHKQHAE